MIGIKKLCSFNGFVDGSRSSVVAVYKSGLNIQKKFIDIDVLTILVQGIVRDPVKQRWKKLEYLDIGFVIQHELRDVRVDTMMNFDLGIDQIDVEYCNKDEIIDKL